MKKFLFTLIIICFFLPKVSFSEELATQGFTGTMCNKFMKTEDTEFNETIIIMEIMGFLNGMNVSHRMHGKKLKIINSNSDRFALDYLQNYCYKNPNKATFNGLIEYFNNLPSFK